MRVQIRPAELKYLAPMSATVSRLTQALHDINTKMSEIARLIELDTGLTANVLRWANSAYYGARLPVESVQAAVVRLGMNNIIHLSIRHSLSAVMKKSVPGYELAENELWRHNVAAALTVETLGQTLEQPLHPGAFTAALLHDVGKVILGQHLSPPLYGQLRKLMETEGLPCLEAERRLLETDHAVVGAALAGFWKFPDELVSAIEKHHEPEPQPDNLLDLVIIANTVAKRIGLSAGSEPVTPAAEAVLERWGLDPLSVAALGERVKEKIAKTEDEWKII
jgi:putative nucleotidyltransferase with HDIG domain